MNEEEEEIRVRPTYNVRVTETPKFDLQQYITNYRGRTVFRRLYLIASCSTAYAEEAARLAIIHAKQGSDVNNYTDALALAASLDIDTSGIADPSWLSKQEKTNAGESKRMEKELQGYKNNLIRESIRMGNEDLGSHYYNTGNLSESLKAYSRMRDYCTTPAHIASNAFRMIQVAIEQKNWLTVQSQVAKIRSLGMKAEEAARSAPKTSAVGGLAAMALGDYKQAATSFLETDPSLADTYNDVISANDVAVYGGLCALASMLRSELQEKVLENDRFRSFLEMEPHIRRAINFFCASKYGQCLEILESYRSDYLLDIYVQDQVPLLYQRIRTKSIVQYFQPFSRVTLTGMEQMFGAYTTTAASTTSATKQQISPAFVEELIDMIDSGQLNARIDLADNVLIAYDESPRAIMQQQAIDTIDAFIREAKIKLLRLNAVSNDLVVKPDKRTRGGGGGGNGGTSAAPGGTDMQNILDGSNGYGNGNFAGQGYSLRGARA